MVLQIFVVKRMYEPPHQMGWRHRHASHDVRLDTHPSFRKETQTTQEQHTTPSGR